VPANLHQVSVNAGSNGVVLGGPQPGGYYVLLEHFVVWAPTTVQSVTANITLRDTLGNFIFLLVYSSVNGIAVNMMVHIPIVTGVTCYNSTAVAASVMIAERQILLPQ
jgi:hypothetical protein